MMKIYSDREFIIVRSSFSVLKKINLENIGFKQIQDSNLYSYQSNEYKILNYSIKPKLIFIIKKEKKNVYLKLKSINVKNIPFIFNLLKVNIELNIFSEGDFCKARRHISIKYGVKNELIANLSGNFINKILNNLIESISIRFDNKLIKKVLKAL